MIYPDAASGSECLWKVHGKLQGIKGVKTCWEMGHAQQGMGCVVCLRQKEEYDSAGTEYPTPTGGMVGNEGSSKDSHL